MPTPRASILVLADSADRLFVSPASIAALLHLEGINDIDTASLDALDETLLAGRSLVVLGPCDPDAETAERLLAFVKNGGGLVVMAPGEALAPKLGLSQKLTVVRNARWALDLFGEGTKPLVVRGFTQLYSLKDANNGEAVGSIRTPEGTPADHSPMLQIKHGSGTVVVLAADIVSAVCLARQGDPLLAGARTTGYTRMRPSDLFDGYDDSDTEQPSADLLCHLLREAVHRAWPTGSVLPWLWYFPDNLDTVIALTSDDDWAVREHFEKLIDCCDRYDARLTFYLTKPTVVDKKWFDELVERGYDFSLHPDLPPPTGATWSKIVADHTAYFRERFGVEPASSIRNHCIAWSGYMHGAKIQLQQGYSWDSNYFTAPPTGRCYMTRAGLPMELIEPSGNVLPAYQLAAQFSDETVLAASGMAFSLKLQPPEAIALVTRIIKENATRNHSMVTINSHPVSFATYSQPLWEPVLKFAKEQGIPVMTVGRLSRFWETRRAVRLRPIPRGQHSVESTVSAGLTAMIPLRAGETAPNMRTVAGRAFAVVRL